MDTLLKDLRYGVRQLTARPGFAAAAIASLALGIGLNTTLFSVVNAVLLRGGPIAAPERLVEIYSGPNDEYPQLTTSYPDFLDIRANTPALAAASANAYVRAILSTSDRPQLVTGEAVTSNYFDVLGLAVLQGRGFRDEENAAPDAAPVAVLSHGLWQRQFGGDAAAIGRTIALSGQPYTIVGVAPAGFTGTMPGVPTDFWVPLMMIERLEFAGVQWTTDDDPGTTRLTRRGTRWLFVKGRLAAGATVEDARSQIATLHARLAQTYPATNERTVSSVVAASSVRFHPMLDPYLRAASAGLLAAVSLVLLIACANVANMLLARGAARRRELAVRAAMGASRRRLIQQLLSEALVLAAVGGGLGVLLAWWAGRLLTGFESTIFPMRISFDFTLDRTVLMFALAASAATAALFGLAPAWSASNPELVPALKASANGGTRRRASVRNVLVVGQLALSLILLVAGALLTRGTLRAQDTDLGFDPAPISSLSFNLQMNGYDVDRAVALRDRAVQTLAALPGVEAVSLASRLPLAPDINMEGVLIPGHHQPGDQPVPVDAVIVGADYFDTVGVPIVAGRAFTEDDQRQQRPLAIVNETMARQYWPNASPIGRQIYPGLFTMTPWEVIGVARDHKVRSVGEDPRPYLHLPGNRSRAIGLIVRTTTPAAAALPMLRDALWQLEPNIVFTEDAPAAEIVAATVAPTSLGALALGAFGGLALLLAAVGLYGVIAYSVSRRTREVGIRMALGAERGQVLRMIMGQGGRLALVGIGIGVLASAAVGQLLHALLYGVSAIDPLAYAVAAGLLLAVAAVANLIPAINASRIDPMVALRTE